MANDLRKDIVRQLRRVDQPYPVDTMLQAADEIERLRSALTARESTRDDVLEEAARYFEARRRQLNPIMVVEELRALKSPSQPVAKECEHEEGDSEYGGRNVCVKCGADTSSAPAPQGLVDDVAPRREQDAMYEALSRVGDALLAIIEARLSTTQMKG